MSEQEQGAADAAEAAGGPDAAARAAAEASKAHRPMLLSASLKITRVQMLEFMTQRDWWSVGQKSLLFTVALWITFVVQMYLRADVENAFRVRDAVFQHVLRITAHPSLSGVAVQTPAELPQPCRCSCQAATRGFTASACDTAGYAERLDFLGLLPVPDKAALLADACEDMPRPLAGFLDSLDTADRYTCEIWFSLYAKANDTASGAQLACSATAYEAYLTERVTNATFANDTLSALLYGEGDFYAPQWKCPRLCGVCDFPVGDGVSPISFAGIGSTEDAWLWVEHGLLPDLLPRNQTGRSGLLQDRNLVVGGLRARQTRAQVPHNCDIASGLQQVYTPQCLSDEPSTLSRLANGTDDAFMPATSPSAEAGMYDAVFDVERPSSVAATLAETLRRAAWLDGATRALKLEALLLNAEAGYLAILQLTFTFGFDGAVERHIAVLPLQVIGWDFRLADFVPELIWLILIAFLLRQELFHLCSMAWQKRLNEYLMDLWNLLDWISISLGALVVIYIAVIVEQTSHLSGMVAALPRAPLPGDLDIASYRRNWGAVLDEAAGVQNFRSWYAFIMFLYTLVITARFLKGFLTQQRLAMIQKSVAHGFWDVVHFQIILVVLLVNFIISGHVLFGAQVQAWSTLPGAASTNIQLLLGTFDFESLYQIFPAAATIWFWLFLLAMVFVMLNLLTAIVIDHFRTMHRLIGPTDSIAHDFIASVRDFMWRCEWRYEQFKDGEYKMIFADPYAELTDGLIENGKIPEQVLKMAQANCLGLRLARARQDSVSVDGLLVDEAREQHPCAGWVTSLELRKIACDPMTAEHLLEECDKNLQSQQSRVRQHHIQITLVRHFVALIRRHRDELAQHCEAIEAGIEEEQNALMDGLERLEGSIIDALDGLEELRSTEVDSLALPPPRLPFAGTTLRDTFTHKLGAQPPRKGTAAVPGRGGLRRTADAGSMLALGNAGGLDPGRAQPALMDGSRAGPGMLTASAARQPQLATVPESRLPMAALIDSPEA